MLTSDGHENRVYELGGDTAFTLAGLAAAVTEATGTNVDYVNLPVDDFAAALQGAGLPDFLAATFAAVDRSIADGWLVVESGDLSRLIGRPTTPLADAVRAAVTG